MFAKSMQVAVASIAALSSFASASNAQSIAECDGALVRATYNRTDKQFVDWRMAERVDEATYNQVKSEAGLSAVIYGVPVGANWGQFKENTASRKHATEQSFTSDTFRNIAWTGLDPNAVSAYSTCLQTVVATRKSLVVLPKTATATDISFEVNYRPVGAAPNPLPVTWAGATAVAGPLPRQIIAGATTIVIRRPAAQSTLALNGSGLSDAVVLTPLPAASVQDPYATRCTVQKTEQPLPQLRKGGSAFWQCGLLKAGNYSFSISVGPSVSPTKMVRVHYALDVLAMVGSNWTTISLPLSAGNTTDLNGGTFPAVFASSGTVYVPQGNVQVRLLITGVADGCCFHNTNYDDGAILIPEAVAIKLERLPGQ